jgi:hypothetical protein
MFAFKSRGFRRGKGSSELGAEPRVKENRPLFNVVIFLVVMTIAALVLIYWGGFKEESRNS